VVVIDYADERTADFATTPWRDWLRTYRSNGPGTAPTDHPGRQDITCEVAIDQLAAVAPPTTNRSQTEFLDAHGINDLAAEARHEWQARAHIGDLQALKQKSRLTEAAALTDPKGLGGFRVLEWVVSNTVSEPQASEPMGTVPRSAGQLPKGATR
jgi:SAM-dependent MidA family methyltransferase